MNEARRISCGMLMEALPELFTDVVGDRETLIRGVCSPDTDERDALVFCAQPKLLQQALESKAAAVVVSARARVEAEARRGSKTILVAANVERAMAETIHRFFLATPYRDPSTAGIHPTAVVDPSAKLAPDIRIGAHAVIGAGVRIGARAFIGANAVIERDCEIGDESTIHPLVYIGHGTKIGAGCEVMPNTTLGKEGFGYAHDERGGRWRIPHQGRVVLEDRVHVGASSCIDRGTFGETRIGAGTIIDNLVHIAHNCRVGKRGIITAKFGMAGSSRIGDNFVAGGDSNVTGHIEITDNVQISGMSGVTASIDKPGQYGGFPLLPLQEHLRMRAALTQLATMRKQVMQMTKRFFKDSDTGAGTTSAD